MINVGLIGTGVGIRTHLPAFRLFKNLNVSGISGSSSERAAAVAAANNIPKAYESHVDLCKAPEIALVCVTSPNHFHVEHTLAALEAGKHVLCEKPLAMTLAETDLLVAAAAGNKGRLALVNHQLRFNPYMKKIRELVRSGALGKIFYCRIHQQGTAFSNRAMPWSWSFDANCGGGVRLAMGSHLLDLSRYIFGTEAIDITCSLDPVVNFRNDSAGVQHTVTGSGYCSIQLRTDLGFPIEIFATAAAHGKSRFDVSIYGDAGEIQFDLEGKIRIAQAEHLGREIVVDTDGVFEDEKQNKVSIFSGSFRYFVAALEKYLYGGDVTSLESASTFDDARSLQVQLDAALLSHQESRSVSLSDNIQPRSTAI